MNSNVRHPVRHGLGFVEMVAAIAVLAVLVALTAQMVGAAHQQRKLTEQIVAGDLAIENLLEECRGIHWDDLTTLRVQETAGPPPLDLQWQINVEIDADDSLGGKLIKVGLQHPVRQLTTSRVVTWRYPFGVTRENGSMQP